MAKSLGDIIRTINYGDGTRNCVGLNPLSGSLLDLTARQRELWALRRSDSQYAAHSADYGDTVVVITVEVPDYIGAHRDGYPVPAHEDIFATVVIPRIELHEVDDIDLNLDGDDYVEHCPECGEVDGFHHSSCTIGGE